MDFQYPDYREFYFHRSVQTLQTSARGSSALAQRMLRLRWNIVRSCTRDNSRKTRDDLSATMRHAKLKLINVLASLGNAIGRKKKGDPLKTVIFEDASLRRSRPWRSFRAVKPAWRHSFDDVWSTAVNAPGRRFLQGTIMLGSLAPTSCAFVHVYEPRAAVHVRALHRKTTGCPESFAFRARWENSGIRASRSRRCQRERDSFERSSCAIIRIFVPHDFTRNCLRSSDD